MSAARDQLRITLDENVGAGHPAAGLGSRMLAQIIDSVLATVLAFVGVALYLGIARLDPERSTLAAAGAGVAALTVYLGYFTIAEMATRGSTPGKSLLGLRVIRLDGGSARSTDLLIRNAARVIDVGLGGVGLAVMFFNPLTRRLGDLAAGTLVVRTRPAVSRTGAAPPGPVMLRTPDAGPAIDGIGQLGERELMVIRTFLSRTGLSPQLRHSLAGDMAAKLHDRLGLTPTAPERGWPPELFLERLYLQLAQRQVAAG